MYMCEWCVCVRCVAVYMVYVVYVCDVCMVCLCVVCRLWRVSLFALSLGLSTGRSLPALSTHGPSAPPSQGLSTDGYEYPLNGQESIPRTEGPAPLQKKHLPTQASLIQTPSDPEASCTDHANAPGHPVLDSGTLQRPAN